MSPCAHHYSKYQLWCSKKKKKNSTKANYPVSLAQINWERTLIFLHLFDLLYWDLGSSDELFQTARKKNDINAKWSVGNQLANPLTESFMQSKR